jgi:sn-glycerol 3-phosphate transport system permease protein
MVDRSPVRDALTHAVLWLGILLVVFPIYYAFVAATLSLEEVARAPMPLIPGRHLLENLQTVWSKAHLGRVLFNTFVMAAGITVGKIAISILSAFAVTYFRFRFRMAAFWMIFVTLMLPVEVRIIPTYAVASNIIAPLQWISEWLYLPELTQALMGRRFELKLELSLLDSYAGLILPLVASATATFLFRQFFLTIPEELAEAAKIDGAGPLRFFWAVLVPMSRTNVAALVVILFVYGWNQYLWPLLITTTPDVSTAMITLRHLMPGPNDPPTWHLAMAGALVILIPPALVVTVMQRWFVQGLIEGEK